MKNERTDPIETEDAVASKRTYRAPCITETSSFDTLALSCGKTNNGPACLARGGISAS